MNFKTFFKGFAIAAIAVATAVSCQEKEEQVVKDSLSVEPSAALSFKAVENADVTLTVTTNVEEWSYTAPEWVVAAKEGNTLVVNAQDNTSKDSRVGRIVFTAGAAESVKINVYQEGNESGEVPGPGAGVAGSFAADAEATIFLGSEAATSSFTFTVESALATDAQIEISLDPEYLAEYSFIMGDSYELLPEANMTFSETLTLAAGETSVTGEVSFTASDDMNFGQGYLVPFVATVKSGDVTIATDDKRANFVVMRKNERTVKQVVYLEVNDCNPLNILEYNLADGTPFFDAVILFAANINYDSVNDVVYLHNNPNVQALLDETEVFLQPLRKRGIKVYLGLLGNHDAAGLAQLSDWGAQEWAQEVAEACRVYKLDGVNLDDEYSSSPDLSNPWFTNHSAAAGARLCYELKMALKEKCYWPTDVSIFEWGSLYNLPTVTTEDGVEHTQSEFIDWTCANYGSSSEPYGDLTYANCSAASIQLNYGYTLSDYAITAAKEYGYGWIMWFAFDPSGTGGIQNNRAHSMAQFEKAAQGLYGQSMAQPENVYNKLGEGKYDPNPSPIQ